VRFKVTYDPWRIGTVRHVTEREARLLKGEDLVDILPDEPANPPPAAPTPPKAAHVPADKMVRPIAPQQQQHHGSSFTKRAQAR
jgi:hypothetical protein